MLKVLSIITLAYSIMGMDMTSLIERLKEVNWLSEPKLLFTYRLQPWAKGKERSEVYKLLQLFYVMDNLKVPVLDRGLIYGAIVFSIFPREKIFIDSYDLMKILEKGDAVDYVYNRVRHHITEEVNDKVEKTMLNWSVK